MTGREAHQEVPPCDWEECQKPSVVEITWGEKTAFPDENKCNKDNLCRKHTDTQVEVIKEDSQLDYDLYAHPEQIRYAHRRVVELQNNLIKEELKKEEANIRVPEKTDPLDIIDWDKTETDVVIAGTYDHQIVLTLYESEEHAKKMNSEHFYEQKSDMIYIVKGSSGARGGPYVDGGLTNQDKYNKPTRQRRHLVENEEEAPEESPASETDNAETEENTEQGERWFS
jgi:hypothetical protein